MITTPCVRCGQITVMAYGLWCCMNCGHRMPTVPAIQAARSQAGERAGVQLHLVDPHVGSQPKPVERTCPNCSAALVAHRCKQVCTGCGYFDDCGIGPA